MISDSIHALRLDVLVLQETRLPDYMKDSVSNFFKLQGITMVVSKEKTRRRGRHHRWSDGSFKVGYHSGSDA